MERFIEFLDAVILVVANLDAQSIGRWRICCKTAVNFLTDEEIWKQVLRNEGLHHIPIRRMQGPPKGDQSLPTYYQAVSQNIYEENKSVSRIESLKNIHCFHPPFMTRYINRSTIDQDLQISGDPSKTYNCKDKNPRAMDAMLLHVGGWDGAEQYKENSPWDIVRRVFKRGELSTDYGTHLKTKKARFCTLGGEEDQEQYVDDSVKHPWRLQKRNFVQFLSLENRDIFFNRTYKLVEVSPRCRASCDLNEAEKEYLKEQSEKYLSDLKAFYDDFYTSYRITDKCYKGYQVSDELEGGSRNAMICVINDKWIRFYWTGRHRVDF